MRQRGFLKEAPLNSPRTFNADIIGCEHRATGVWWGVTWRKRRIVECNLFDARQPLTEAERHMGRSLQGFILGGALDGLRTFQGRNP